jgi:hypothetical protein
MSNSSPLSVTTKKSIEGFYRVFRPFATSQEITSAVRSKVTLEELYAGLLPKRFIPLSKQEDVFYPEQRSKEWFEKRKKVPSTITGSRPAGWYFDICNPETYKEHLAYVHEGKKQHFSPEAIKRMNYGTKFEDYAQSVFIEYFTKHLQRNIYVYETGFQRNTELPFLGSSPDGLVSEHVFGKVVAKQKSRTFENQWDYRVQYCDEHGALSYYTIHGDERMQLARDNIDKLLDLEVRKEELQKLEQPFLGNSSWEPCEECYVYGAKFSILEIKCPQKIYSSIPYYYMCQLHSEMASFNIDETYFMCWGTKQDEEKLRVWKLKFNPAFFQDFLNIVDLFRIRNYDGSRGAPWSVFGLHWFQFKMKYSRKEAWYNYVTPYFAPRQYCISRPYKASSTE